MKNIILIILLLISIAGQAQVPGTFRYVRLMNADSAHGDINGTEYLTSAGFYRYREAGVWYYRASTADIAAAAPTASNGLTKVVNDFRLGGTLSSNTTINGNSSSLSLGATGNKLFNFTVNNSNLATIGSDNGINLNSGNGVNLNSVTGNVQSSSTAGAFVVSTNSTNRFQIDNDGSWTINSTPGTAGQVLTSAGASSTPTWTNASSLPFWPLNANASLSTNVAINALTHQLDIEGNSGESGITWTNNLTLFTNTGRNLILNVGGSTLFSNAASISGPSFSIGSTSGDIAIASFNSVPISGASISLQTIGGDLTLNVGDDIILPGALTNNNALTSLMGRNSVSGEIEERTVASITGIPAGSNTQVQFNNSGAFGADADLTFTGGNTLNATNTIVTTGLTNSALTSGRIVMAGTAGLLGDDADLTFSSSTLTATNATVTTALINSALTDTRIPVIGASGLFTDDAQLVYDATNNILTLATDIILNGTADAISISGSGGNTSLLVSGLTRQTGSQDIGISTTGVNIRLNPRIGGGTSYIIIENIPTTCAGAPTGAIANIAGVLNICP